MTTSGEKQKSNLLLNVISGTPVKVLHYLCFLQFQQRWKAPDPETDNTMSRKDKSSDKLRILEEITGFQ